MKLDTLLVIADCDDPAQPAVRAALDLLPAATGRVRVVGFAYEHAVDEPGVLSATAAATLKAALLADRQRWLEQCVAELPSEGRLQVEAAWAADPVDWTVDTASRDNVDLVVKTGHRNTRLLYTPADWQLLRRCPVPVLFAGARPRGAARILAAIDAGSDDPVQVALNRKVLDAAVRLAQPLRAQVHPVYVIAVSKIARDLDLIDARALEREQRARVGPMLVAMAGEYGIPAGNVIIKLGQPERVLPSLAAGGKADLVVMGTVGRTGVAGRLLGNTAEQVLQRLRTSLLALRPD